MISIDVYEVKASIHSFNSFPELNPEILSNVHLCKQDQLSSYLNVRRTHTISQT